MLFRRLFLLLTVALMLHRVSADEPDAKKKEEGPKKPTAEQIDAAVRAIQGDDPMKVQDRLDALEVLERAGNPKIVPALFDSSVRTQVGAYAVRAGELANALDAKAALRAYDNGYKKLPKQSFAPSNAVRFLGELKAPGVGERLTARVKGKNLWVKTEALYGLVKLGDEKHYGPLLSALKGTNKELRVTGAICCGLARYQKASGTLLKALDTDAEDLNMFAAWALGRMRDPELLEKAIRSSKGRAAGSVIYAKCKAILECSFDPDKHIPILIGLVTSGNKVVAGAAINGLAEIGQGNELAADALVPVVFDGRRKDLASMAADALGRIGSPAQGERILARYQANPGRITPWAVRALGLLKTQKAANLLHHMVYTHKDLVMRKRAAIAFWQCADSKARKEFKEKLFKTRHPRQVSAGCLALGFNRSDEGFHFAVTLLREHFGKKTILPVRGALERMTGHRFAPSKRIWNDWYSKHSDFFKRKPQFLNRNEWRKQLLDKQEMGISKLTESAVELGLEWLARHQSPDGRWSGDKFTAHCKAYYNKKCQIGARLGDWDLGMTGISLLAFYGAGYAPDQGRYKDNVLRAQIYCAARQWPDGDFGGQADLIGGYTRPIATIALAEAYGTSRDPDYLARARRSVAHIIRIQYPDSGWRYRLGGQFPGDTSVTGWNAWSIATARKFGIPVDPMGLEGANSLIDQFSSRVTQDEEYYNTDPKYFFEVGRGSKYEHFTGYNAQENSRPPMTAIGLICKIFMDRRRSHPYCIGAANRLLESIPEYNERNNTIKYTAGAEWPAYYWYYGSLAMFQMGGSYWRKWSRPLLTEAIPKVQVKGNQCDRGSWDCGNLDSIGGRVYTTAMTVLTLETFYRYLPVLQGK